jgi:hypothetical protein
VLEDVDDNRNELLLSSPKKEEREKRRKSRKKREKREKRLQRRLTSDLEEGLQQQGRDSPMFVTK